jgi:exodeoxyribonuclease-5
MILSPDQERALSAVSSWMQKPDSPIFRLFGYAGTGKSTIARHIRDGVEGRVCAAAYTGKAALVMQRNGFPDACTIHSLIYRGGDRSRVRLLELERLLLHATQPELALTTEVAELAKKHGNLSTNDLRLEIAKEKDNVKQPAFTLNEESAVKDAKLVVIDECSMVDARIAQDLLSFNVKLLVMGDPAQLPPVKGTGYFIDGHPDAMLTQIHRQAADNPIIRMATMIREGRELPLGDYGESQVILKASCTKEIAMAADQILVGRNITRFKMNKRLRELHGFELALPQEGDKLVCLRNDSENGLLNGGLWRTQASFDEGDGRVALSLTSEDDGRSAAVEAHAAHFLGEGDSIDWYERKEAQEFDYGYALTVHKAQGSQWPCVVLFDEWSFNSRKEWLYTAVTRAQERVIIAR